jgi:hypothetical protein
MPSSRIRRRTLGAVLIAIVVAAACSVLAGSASATPSTGGATSPITQIAGGGAHTCALHLDGTLTCWGANDAGQLGIGTSTRGSTTPVTVSGITTAVAVTAGANHSCALLRGGTIRCWGNNGDGQLGDGTTKFSYVPVPVTDITNATAVSAEWDHTCARLADGIVRCWGDNTNGELGNGTTTNSTAPVPVTGISDATTIAAGGFDTCALRSDGTASCWGSDGFGQPVGLDPGATATDLPINVEGLTDATAIAVDRHHRCALLGGGTIRCWGNNDQGQLGNGTTTNSTAPVPVVDITHATNVAVGEAHSCAVLSDGTARCWGYNYSGQLGNGTTHNSNVPVTVHPVRSVAESFVTAAYQDYIGRAPTGPELAAGLAVAGDASSIEKRSQFTTALAQSDTYLGAVVNNLYVDTLGRVGDAGGVAYWTNQLRTGQITVAQAAGLFYASPEYFSGYGHNDLSTWVTDLYNKVLHRAPDPGGLAYYVNLAPTTNRYTVAYPFYQSLESSNTRVKALYLHFLQRPADQGGLDYWANKIPTLGDVALASNLTLSSEYLSKATTRYP